MTAEPVIDQQQAKATAGMPATTEVPATVRASLSPSRAADFKTCPLLYRFRSIDRLPERPSVEQARGTLVHAVLERLFDLPAAGRTPEAAGDLVGPQWDRLVTEQPELAGLFDAGDPAGTAEFLRAAAGLLEGYFAVEDPRRLEPAEREALISAVVDDELLIRGYLDRLDVAPDGALRVVDYKTGGAPREAFEARALFQLKFYALVLWRTRGVVPRVLRLLYLKDAEICDYAPDADELLRFERTVVALWQAIETATARQDFRPRPSRLCDWCNHQALCPSFGGTPPPFPAAAGSADPMVDARSRPAPPGADE
ncbi:RecB family exonuclease [Micromonospora rubida]|uniref:RecB family exonuclease n=1 Tax=Micromonospora rubida TaxID=2697657 RepID=UPI001378E025|nr:PD-(D/E)XK nuclease family protein [Micromonospora rubida]NBE83937.1 recombinase RecB [Micromonospora rubida]